MPKVGMQEIRKKQLVEATLSLIGEQGLAGTSMAQVSARSGMSNGIVHHYFSDKNALLEATLRELNKRINAEIFNHLRQSKTPSERVQAFVEGNVSALNLTRENVAAWLAFWAQVPQFPQFQRIQNIVARRSHSLLFHALAKSMDKTTARYKAQMIAVFIDGLWLRAAVDPTPETIGDSRRLAYEFLNNLLGYDLKV
ncbi:transcriptional regulator BetI [Pseudomonas sp. BN411]|uniref:transcriptional regulator BetI n=1 Tax=Pseudomonas sp. BN411 TaxID=2567887 RepID=UPI002453D67E|nr:transcriptional regulator BetI [Pseudomonas sp. BN411]MDH4564191.1 transcriptional regulator BetI [Pseudomonas sp. BN411]